VLANPVLGLSLSDLQDVKSRRADILFDFLPEASVGSCITCSKKTRDMSRDPLQQQIDYYQTRAAEYDQWFFRQGRYDRGEEVNARWFRDVEEVRGALDLVEPSGVILELAAGTGLWTERLLPHADTLTVVDASSEMLSLNKQRVGRDQVRHIQADVFDWVPDKTYDFVFFGFWLSHVPLERFESFWTKVKASLSENGRFFFVDSLADTTSTARNHVLPSAGSGRAGRKLNDGREFEIIKIFYDPAVLEDDLSQMGFNATVETTSTYFLFGSGRVEN